MNSNFHLGDDGSIFFIGDDGTINRLGKIDRNGNVKGKSSGKSVGILWFFLMVAVITTMILGVNLSEAKSSLSDYSKTQSNLKSEIDELKRKNENLSIENNNLDQTNSNLQSEISSLERQVPTWYRVISRADYYLKCGNGEYEKANCYSPSGSPVRVYEIDNGYGLTKFGWVYMYYLETY
jgi:FtsZ-binding cell division protein ZapB